MDNDACIRLIEEVIRYAREDWKVGKKYIDLCERRGKEPDSAKTIMKNFWTADTFLKSLDKWEDVEFALLEEMRNEC